MKNKKILITVIFSVVCACAILAVILLANNQRKNAGATAGADTNALQSFASLEEAEEWAEFPLQTTGRLNGILATDYSADKASIKVTYGEAGYVTKTMIPDVVSDTALPSEKPAETVSEDSAIRTEYEINDVNVVFVGDENAVTKAEWTDNGFDYAIVLTHSSVTADMMTDYVSAIR